MRSPTQNHRTLLLSFVVLLCLVGALLACDGQDATVGVPVTADAKTRLRVCSSILTNLVFTGMKKGPNVKIVTTQTRLFDTNRIMLLPGSFDLLAQLEQLVWTDFSRTPYEGKGWVTNLGDILLRFQAFQNEPGATVKFWSLMRSNAPNIHTKIYPALSPLIDQAGFSGFGMTPWGTNDLPDDGFLHGRGGKSNTSKDLAQIATLIFFNQGASARFSDGCQVMQFIKRQDLDLSSYPKRTGLDSPYRSAKLKGNQVASDTNGTFALYTIEYVVDISRKPKPAVASDSINIESHIMESFDRDGYWRTDYYGKGTVSVLLLGSSTQLEFEGNDTYIPIYTSDGRFVAVLMTTSVAAKGENPWLIGRENIGSLKLLTEDFLYRLGR
jgi:hypothetical protein